MKNLFFYSPYAIIYWLITIIAISSVIVLGASIIHTLQRRKSWKQIKEELKFIAPEMPLPLKLRHAIEALKGAGVLYNKGMYELSQTYIKLALDIIEMHNHDTIKDVDDKIFDKDKEDNGNHPLVSDHSIIVHEIRNKTWSVDNTRKCANNGEHVWKMIGPNRYQCDICHVLR